MEETVTPLGILRKIASDLANPDVIRKKAIAAILREKPDDEYALDVLLPMVIEMSKSEKADITIWAIETRLKIERTYRRDWRKHSNKMSEAPVNGASQENT